MTEFRLTYYSYSGFMTDLINIDHEQLSTGLPQINGINAHVTFIYVQARDMKAKLKQVAAGLRRSLIMA